MSSIASLIVRIGAQDQEIQRALASVGEKARSLDADLKKLGNTPLASGAQKSLETMKTTIDQITTAQQHLAERATFAAKGLEALGGASRLTDTQLKQVNKTLQDGLSAYSALGKEAPASLRSVASEVQTLSTRTKGLTDLKGSIVSLGAAFGAAFSVAQVVNFGKELLRMGDDIVRVSDRTGLLTSEVQKLSFIAAQSGNSIEELTQATGQLQNRLASGDKSAVSAVDKLGLSFEKLRQAGPFQQLEQIADAVAKIPDPATRAQVAMDLFGRSGIAILPTLTAQFKALGDAAPIMSDKTVRALDQAGDALGKFQLQIKVWAAESYNLAGRVFDRLTIAILRTTAGFMDATANLLSLTTKLPGASTLFPGAAGSLNDLRERAQFARDAAKALEDMGTTSVESTRKAATGFAGLETSVAQLDSQTAKHTTTVKDLNDEYQKTLQRENELFAVRQQIAGVLPFLTGGFQIGTGLGTAPAQISLTGQRQAASPLGTAPTSILGAAHDNIQSATSASIFSGLSTAIPQSILAALQGGGNVAASVAGTTGAHIGTSVVEKFGSAITDKLGKTFGSAINAILPGLGALAAPLVNFIAKIFGPSEESSKVSPLRDAFFKAAGGLDVLNPKVLQLTGNLKAVEDVFKAKTVDDYNAAIQRLNTVLGAQDAALADLNAAVQKYGFSIEELGPKFRQQKLDELAGSLLKDYDLLIASGIANDTVLQHMAGSFQELANTALRTGAEIPENLKPALQRLVDLGLLVDGDGKKLTTLGGINFSEPMSRGFDRVVAAINNLTKALGGAVAQVDELAQDRDFDITGHVKVDASNARDLPGDISIPLEGSATGSIVRPWGLQHFASGGIVAPDNRLVAVSDGELIMNVAQQKNVADALTGRPIILEIHNHGPILAEQAYVERMGQWMLNGIRRYAMPDFTRLVASVTP